MIRQLQNIIRTSRSMLGGVISSSSGREVKSDNVRTQPETLPNVSRSTFTRLLLQDQSIIERNNLFGKEKSIKEKEDMLMKVISIIDHKLTRHYLSHLKELQSLFNAANEMNIRSTSIDNWEKKKDYRFFFRHNIRNLLKISSFVEYDYDDLIKKRNLFKRYGLIVKLDEKKKQNISIWIREPIGEVEKKVNFFQKKQMKSFENIVVLWEDDKMINIGGYNRVEEDNIENIFPIHLQELESDYIERTFQLIAKYSTFVFGGSLFINHILLMRGINIEMNQILFTSFLSTLSLYQLQENFINKRRQKFLIDIIHRQNENCIKNLPLLPILLDDVIDQKYKETLLIYFTLLHMQPIFIDSHDKKITNWLPINGATQQMIEGRINEWMSSRLTNSNSKKRIDFQINFLSAISSLKELNILKKTDDRYQVMALEQIINEFPIDNDYVRFVESQLLKSDAFDLFQTK